MSKVNIAVLKDTFATGDTPLGADYANLIDTLNVGPELELKIAERAAATGDSTKTFSVATAVSTNQAVSFGQAQSLFVSNTSTIDCGTIA